MQLTVGAQVRHVSGGDAGVIIRLDGSVAHVAFPGTTDYVHLEDLAPLEPNATGLLAAGKIGDSSAAHLRLLARLVQHARVYDPTAALTSARLEPRLHQAFVAHRVVNKIAPRMILADEVGLGKTIEAGLILKELRARRLVNRVLIVTPASLARQWQTELASKFNEQFEIMDGAAAKHLGRGGRNPFTTIDSAICSYQFATMGKRPDQIVEAGWDLVIFDEAHRVRRSGSRASNHKVTEAYRLADELRDAVHGLLLLSATPVQLHAYELFSLVELVEPGLFPSFDAFERQRGSIPKLNELMRVLMSWETLTERERVQGLQTSDSLLSRLGFEPEALAEPDQRNRAKQQLTEQHPLADALVRNRKANLGLQGTRHAHIIAVQLSPDELSVHEKVVDYLRAAYQLAIGQNNNAVGFLMVTYLKMLTSSSHALRTSFRRRIAALERVLQEPGGKPKAKARDDGWRDAEEVSEVLEVVETSSEEVARARVEIELLQDLVADLDELRDSKIAELVRLVLNMDGAKVVVFTQFIETQLFLQKALEANGVSVAIFNGRMNADEKEMAIHDFRSAAQVLVSTESGGEGRNLQFAHILVNYDLPWNPMRVEQRIGRLDRIGQHETVQIYNMVCQETLDERVIEVLADRIRLFEESVGALDPILGTIEKDIERLLLGAEDNSDQQFDAYADDLERKVAEARLLERTMADFVLDQASFRMDEARRLLGQEPLVTPQDLTRVLESGLEYLGGRALPHVEGGKSITLSPKLAGKLGTTSTTWRGVFDPAEAVRLDEVDFFALGHPLVERLLTALTALPDSEVGYRKSPDVPPGQWVEVVRELTARVGPGSGRLIRHLVGEDGGVESQEVNALPLADVPVRGAAPDWVATALRESERFFQSELEQFRLEIDAKFKTDQAAQLERLDRVYRSQRLRLENQIASEDAWLAERRESANDRDKKIIPAREGRLAKARERLQALSDERELAVEELRSRQPYVRASTIGVGIVEGVS